MDLSSLIILATIFFTMLMMVMCLLFCYIPIHLACTVCPSFNKLDKSLRKVDVWLLFSSKKNKIHYFQACNATYNFGFERRGHLTFLHFVPINKFEESVLPDWSMRTIRHAESSLWDSLKQLQKWRVIWYKKHVNQVIIIVIFDHRQTKLDSNIKVHKSNQERLVGPNCKTTILPKQRKILQMQWNLVLKDHSIANKNTVSQDRCRSLVTGSFTLNCRTFCQKLMVLHCRWSLMLMVSKDRFHCMYLYLNIFVIIWITMAINNSKLQWL